MRAKTNPKCQQWPGEIGEEEETEEDEETGEARAGEVLKVKPDLGALDIAQIHQNLVATAIILMAIKVGIV